LCQSTFAAVCGSQNRIENVFVEESEYLLFFGHEMPSSPDHRAAELWFCWMGPEPIGVFGAPTTRLPSRQASTAMSFVFSSILVAISIFKPEEGKKWKATRFPE
jgi:hypothetical protein